MPTKSNLRIEERLNEKNFENWEFILEKILKSKEIFEYVESDVIGELNEKHEKEKNTPGNQKNSTKTIQNLEVKIKQAQKEDAMASA